MRKWGAIIILCLLGWAVGRPQAGPVVCDIRDGIQIKRQSGVVLVALKDFENDLNYYGDCNPLPTDVSKRIANLQDEVRKLALELSDNQ